MERIYRAPEFQELYEYLIAEYGKEKGEYYYKEWLEFYGFDESVPMLMQKKLKGLDLTQKEHEQGIKEMWKKAREQILTDAMQKEGHELYQFAEKVRNADPSYQEHVKEQQAQFSDAEDKMLADSVLRETNPITRSAAFGNLAKRLSEKYGDKAMEKAKQLLGEESE